MAQFVIATDLNRCVGCLACSVSCKVANGVNVGDFWLKFCASGLILSPAEADNGRMWSITTFPCSASTAPIPSA